MKNKLYKSKYPLINYKEADGRNMYMINEQSSYN
jgi:hypothetical protein